MSQFGSLPGKLWLAQKAGLVLTWALSGYACVPAASPPRATPTPSAANPGAAPAAASVSAPAAALPRELPELAQHFDAEKVQGSIALLDTNDDVLSCSNVARCTTPAPPASTFKVPHAAIALELGILEDSESPMPWDGKTYAVSDWNRDHTLRTAMRVSCLPCFQSVARRLGPARLADWVARFEYGNRDITGAPDRFWLDGALRISPVQQIDFLKRLDEEKLPLQKRTSEIVKEIITLDVGQNHVLRGKTGLLQPPEQPHLYGWFVGWVELGARRVYFATLLEGAAADVDPIPARRRVTERILRALQVLP